MFTYCRVEALQDKIHLCQCCIAPAIASSTIFILGLCFADFKWCFLQNSSDQYWDFAEDFQSPFNHMGNRFFQSVLTCWGQKGTCCTQMPKRVLRNLAWCNLDSWVSISKGFSHTGFGTKQLTALQKLHCQVNFRPALKAMANLGTYSWGSFKTICKRNWEAEPQAGTF